MFPSSRVDTVTFHNFSFFLKRDDLLHPDFSGNKARKLHYFLTNDFPNVKKVVSYGSMQSNAMYSLSVLAKLKAWRFEYYTRINEELLKDPKGNLKGALENEMEIIDIGDWTLDIGDRNLLSECQVVEDTLIIPEGVRSKEAEYGIKLLADEIIEWAKEKNIKELDIFLPSGTGTAALYLQKHLINVQFSMSNVYTVPCVGDERYLKEQFMALEPNEQFHPQILKPPKKYKFGKLYKELYEIWCELKNETQIEFDLLYDPIAFKTILSNSQFLIPNSFLYIHQGGIKGNETMIERYKKKFVRII